MDGRETFNAPVIAGEDQQRRPCQSICKPNSQMNSSTNANVAHRRWRALRR
jgi:hypothetical protein